LEYYLVEFVVTVAKALLSMVLTVFSLAQLELFHSLTRMELLDVRLAQLSLDSFSQATNVFLVQQLPQQLQLQE
jgi:hypothetical protein